MQPGQGPLCEPHVALSGLQAAGHAEASLPVPVAGSGARGHAEAAAHPAGARAPTPQLGGAAPGSAEPAGGALQLVPAPRCLRNLVRAASARCADGLRLRPFTWALPAWQVVALQAARLPPPRPYPWSVADAVALQRAMAARWAAAEDRFELQLQLCMVRLPPFASLALVLFSVTETFCASSTK